MAALPASVNWWSISPSERAAFRDPLVASVTARLDDQRDARAWRETLLEIADALDCAGSALWLPDANLELRCRLFVSSVAMEMFEAQSREAAFARGVGMPGRTWLHAQAEWIPNVIKDDNFPRLRGAIRDLVRAVVAFPLLVDENAIGVVELYSRRVLHEDDETSRLLRDLGVALGNCHAALLHLASDES